MRNRAKCRLCNEIIESFHRGDYVSCKCDEIAVSGGNEKLEVFAKNWANFMRVDDEGNEIIIAVEEKKDASITEATKESLTLPPVTHDDFVKMLEEFCQNIENLPADAKFSSVTHVDLVSVLRILVDIFRSS